MVDVNSLSLVFNGVTMATAIGAAIGIGRFMQTQKGHGDQLAGHAKAIETVTVQSANHEKCIAVLSMRDDQQDRTLHEQGNHMIRHDGELSVLNAKWSSVAHLGP